MGAFSTSVTAVGRDWVTLVYVCTSYRSSWHMVGAQDVSAEVPLAEAEAVVLGSARREPKTS